MISLFDLSVIVPVGPEEKCLTNLLKDLESYKKDVEVLVMEGSSRPRQLNEGAKKASRPFLWFLHADSRLSPKTLSALLHSLNRRPDALHYFILKFLPDGPRLMFLNEIGCRIRSRWMGVPFGDQGFCISRQNFDKIGGFPDSAPYGEDHLFVWRARQKGIRLHCTGAVLKTSARRYAQTGWAKLTWTYARRWTRQAWVEWRKIVIPAQAGIQEKPLDSRFRWNDTRRTLILFAKYPQPGRVKSRLAQAVGANEAAQIYQKMVETVLERTAPRNGEYARILYFDPPERDRDFQAWLGFENRRPQSGGDLGERMQNAFAQTLGEAGRAVVIGTDCLDIDQQLIGEAFTRLESADLVLGPAQDGGYYLMGCKKVYPELFRDMPWSTSGVLVQTLQRASDLKLNVFLLPEKTDLDTVEDLSRWRQKNII